MACALVSSEERGNLEAEGDVEAEEDLDKDVEEEQHLAKDLEERISSISLFSSCSSSSCSN